MKNNSKKTVRRRNGRLFLRAFIISGTISLCLCAFVYGCFTVDAAAREILTGDRRGAFYIETDGNKTNIGLFGKEYTILSGSQSIDMSSDTKSK